MYKLKSRKNIGYVLAITGLVPVLLLAKGEINPTIGTLDLLLIIILRVGGWIFILFEIVWSIAIINLMSNHTISDGIGTLCLISNVITIFNEIKR